jgi:class 3 adenylate cyclase
MIFFNGPVVVPDPVERAIRMAVAMCGRVEQLRDGWPNRDYDLGLGIGIAQGYATIGAIGFEGRRDYGAIGTVTNLAARLCRRSADDRGAARGSYPAPLGVVTPQISVVRCPKSGGHPPGHEAQACPA